MSRPSNLAALVVLTLACGRPSTTPTSDASVSPLSGPSVDAATTSADAAIHAGPSGSTFVLTVDDRTINGTPKCKVFVLASQSRSTVSWHGQCKNGFADGLGVVRYVDDGIPDANFYGILKDGYWESGVYAQGGYTAGQFKNNEPIEIKDVSGFDARNVMIRAFDTGAKAATRLSEALAKQGNNDSAKHYRDVAKKLSNQLD